MAIAWRITGIGMGGAIGQDLQLEQASSPKTGHRGRASAWLAPKGMRNALPLHRFQPLSRLNWRRMTNLRPVKTLVSMDVIPAIC